MRMGQRKVKAVRRQVRKEWGEQYSKARGDVRKQFDAFYDAIFKLGFWARVRIALMVIKGG
jgi:hypothetical protein